MATGVAWASLMANSDKRFRDPTAAARFVTWVLPPCRRDWAEAMLNETGYIGSRRGGLCWILGCTLFAIKVRASYELQRTFVSRGLNKLLLRLGAVTVIAVIGIYAIQKPYQRDRIRITILRDIGASTANPSAPIR